MPISSPSVVIDARPRGPRGPIAGELVLGRPVLAHLLDLARAVGPGPVVVHARLEDQGGLRALLDEPNSLVDFAPGPPPEDATILRADRLYDPGRLRRAVQRGRDPERAVLWRLDQPHGLAGAADELTRRRTYQPIGHYWALGPARLLARGLRPTRVRPNAVTGTAGGLVLLASVLVGIGSASLSWRLATAAALALALVLDTADGHLARLQGTASDFGRWLDVFLDELGDMALHAGIAWGAFARDGQPAWLALGMIYAMGKYVFVITTTAPDADADADAEAKSKSRGEGPAAPPSRRGTALTSWVRLAGHADVRWHLWIALASLGRLDVALASYAIYFPVRALAGAGRKVVRHG